MKKFETPEVEITEFAVEDVVTTSGGNNGGSTMGPTFCGDDL